MRDRRPPTGPIALVGTTASGKSALALAIARAVPDIEIVSVDSMQVYRGMDIGTAKPTASERAEIPHHLLDLVDPHEDFTVTRFQAHATEAIADIEARGRRALLVGGTGLYLRAVVDGLDVPGQYPDTRSELEGDPDTEGLHRRLQQLDPVAARRMEPTNRRRVLRALEVTLGSGQPFSSFGPGLEQYPDSRFTMIGVALPPDVIRQRIADRYDAQMADGFLAEVERLHDRPEGLSRTAGQALGYKELLGHLDGDSSLDEALDLAVRRTRQFARRQRSWFRRDPRIHWVTAEEEPLTVLPDLLRDWYRCG